MTSPEVATHRRVIVRRLRQRGLSAATIEILLPEWTDLLDAKETHCPGHVVPRSARTHEAAATRDGTGRRS